MDGVLAVLRHRSHWGNRARDGHVLKLSAAVLSAENVGSVRIVRQDRNNIERLRRVSGERELNINPFCRGGRRHNTEPEVFSSSIIAKSSLKRRTITPHKLIATVQNHLRRIGAFRRKREA
jgi:hypothetical protein